MAQRLPVLGFLNSRSRVESTGHTAAFLDGLKASGYVDGRNIRIEYRWAEGDYARLPALASELLQIGPAVLVSAGGSVTARAAKAATGTVPIVFLLGLDPVRLGLVASFNRPGGNITGVCFITTELGAKRVAILAELLPGMKRVGLMQNRASPDTDFHRSEVATAATVLGRDIVVADASAAEEIETAIGALKQQDADALIVQNDPFFDSQRDRIVALAARFALPAIYHIREFPEGGGLASYGASLTDTYRELGTQTARVLRGEKPADMPVQTPTRFELVVNLKTARTLAVAVPDTILARADEVIE